MGRKCRILCHARFHSQLVDDSRNVVNAIPFRILNANLPSYMRTQHQSFHFQIMGMLNILGFIKYLENEIFSLR